MVQVSSLLISLQRWRLNKSNRKIGEMRAPNISTDEGFSLYRIVLDAVHRVSEIPTIFHYLILI